MMKTDGKENLPLMLRIRVNRRIERKEQAKYGFYWFNIGLR